MTRDQNWEAWLLYLIEGVEVTARWTRAKIEAVHILHKDTKAYVRSRLPKIYSYELINLIFELPYCRIQNVVDAKIAKRQAASRYLKELVEIGVLEKLQMGREKLFVHPKYVRLLTRDGDEFAPHQ